MSKEFTFKVLNEESESGYSPYVRLTPKGFELDGRNMLDKDKILIRGNKITIAVSYPLDGEYISDITIDEGSNFTRFALAETVSRLYQLIYKEEKETATLPIESVAERASRTGCTKCPRLMNRACSSGKYGICMHGLGDLVLHTVYYDPNRDLYTLGIDS
uniref:Uncharacterized protein n=1 Tax=Pithovirus LCPAC401 TaxID=2506595 RepID=A0A481ZA33_9VIRU|nr:MAG: uncharacterized protein LCPAC401_01240 [Pithovirus LCPAC401]